MKGPKTDRFDPKWAGIGSNQIGSVKNSSRENELSSINRILRTLKFLGIIYLKKLNYIILLIINNDD